MAPENEKRILAEMLAGLTKPALRVLSIRYGTSQSRIGLWRKSKGQLIEDLLAHTDELLVDHVKAELAENSPSQIESEAGQVDLKEQLQKRDEELKAFFASKIEVRWREELWNSITGWVPTLIAGLKKRQGLIFGWIAVVGFLLTVASFLLGLIPFFRPEMPPEPYQVNIHVLEEDGSHAVGATVNAPPWQPVAKKKHWLLTIPIEEVPEDGALTLKARKNEGSAEKEVRLAQKRRFSVTLNLRYPNAMIRGTVLSPNGEPVAGARVNVFGHEGEAVLSDEDGSFSIPAHAAIGEDIRLTVRKGSWRRVGHYLAGDFYEIRLIDKGN